VRIDVAGEAVARLPVRARNLSAPSVHEGRACRWVRGDEARVFVAMVPDGPIVLTVTAAPADPDRETELAVAWNEIPLGAQPMTAGWGEYGYHVPAAFLRPGTNAVTLSFQRAADRPREVRRSAAVAAVALERR
jgi:hypothetical protein